MTDQTMTDNTLKRKEISSGNDHPAADALNTAATETGNPAKRTAAENDNSESYVATKMQELQQEAATIREGIHPEVVSGVANLEATRSKELAKVQRSYELRLAEAKALLDFEKKEVEDCFEGGVRELKERLLAEVDESLRTLESLKSGGIEEQVRVSTRKLRSKGKTAGGEILMELEQDKGLTTTPSRRAKSDLFNMTLAVDEPDILNDMNAIYSEWRTLAEKKLSKKALKEELVRYESGRLVVGEQMLEKGDFVQVKDNTNQEEYYGTVSAVHTDEIVVKVVDNSKSHITFRDIRSGRCSIMRDPDDA